MVSIIIYMVRCTLPSWEQSNPLNPSGQSHLKHFTPSSEHLPLFLHGFLSQGRTEKKDVCNHYRH